MSEKPLTLAQQGTVLTDLWWIEARGATMCSAMHRTAGYRKGCVAQSINSVSVEKGEGGTLSLEF